jgi:hypothetical protein
MHTTWLHPFQDHCHRRNEDASGGIQGIINKEDYEKNKC